MIQYNCVKRRTEEFPQDSIRHCVFYFKYGFTAYACWGCNPYKLPGQ